VVNAPPDRVYASLLDPATIAGAVPVLASHRVVDDDHWEAQVKVPLPFAPSVTVRFEIVERRRPEHAAIRSNGAGAHVASCFDLEPDGAATRIRWCAEIELGGMLAIFGGPRFEPLARRAAERVLDRVAAAAIVREA
jgi:carbon monoxide dehydrogenase subunit G